MAHQLHLNVYTATSFHPSSTAPHQGRIIVECKMNVTFDANELNYQQMSYIEPNELNPVMCGGASDTRRVNDNPKPIKARALPSF